MKNLGCTKEKWKVFYTKPGRISYVCNWGYDGQSCICGEYSKPIHVKDQPIILDGCLRGKDIAFRGVLNADWTGDANYRPSTTEYNNVPCWRWNHFRKMQQLTNHCIIYDGGGVHGY